MISVSYGRLGLFGFKEEIMKQETNETAQMATFRAGRARNNVVIGLILVGFVALVFAITVAKMMSGGCLEAPDHVLRNCLLIEEQNS